MREWLSGRASPCQGEGREFESRFALIKTTSISAGCFVLRRLLTAVFYFFQILIQFTDLFQ